MSIRVHDCSTASGPACSSDVHLAVVPDGLRLLLRRAIAIGDVVASKNEIAYVRSVCLPVCTRKLPLLQRGSIVHLPSFTASEIASLHCQSLDQLGICTGTADEVTNSPNVYSTEQRGTLAGPMTPY